MARPTKIRRVCDIPSNLSFSPEVKKGGEPIVMTVDEYETVRLIDKEGLSQEECAVQLGVGRTTVQKIYDTARKKLAESLVMGLPLKIEGGDFSVCDGNSDSCYKRKCGKNQTRQRYSLDKGEGVMRIAVTYENGSVFQHFGHTEQFKIYDVTDKKVIKSETVSVNSAGHGALAEILSDVSADVLICGGIGGGAKAALAETGIKLVGGVTGGADEAVNAYLAGTLSFDPDARCERHAHGEEIGHCGERCGR